MQVHLLLLVVVIMMPEMAMNEAMVRTYRVIVASLEDSRALEVARVESMERLALYQH